MTHARLITILIVAMTLGGCAQIGSAPTATPRPLAAQITITRPVPGVTIASPVLVSGVVSRLPASGFLTYQVYDARNVMVGTGTIPVRASGDDALRFETQVVYAGAQAGPGKILIVDIAADNNSVQASAELPVTLSGPGGAVTLPSQVAGAPTLQAGIPTPLPGLATPIVIYPAPLPPGGATALPGMATPQPALVSPTPVAPGTAPAQQIVFESPAPGTLVGSPVLISGHTTGYPFQGNLSYTIRDAANQIVGQGLIGVDGPEGGPGTFRVELDFNQPAQPGALSIELADEDAVSGTVAARTTLVVSFGTPIGQ
ncbi:MAG TPA: Gmad2 immunoglobulin-like domain-containing protein, partial [Roseiflexaceae bacterium]|nr:Gmad2 immunoglobulin-like domain-containing protein [Roseiflexaceae bacterium]